MCYRYYEPSFKFPEMSNTVDIKIHIAIDNTGLS